MNRNIKSNFDKISKYAQNYKKAIREALTEFRGTMAAAEAEAERYKDSAGFLAERKAAAQTKARNSIQIAENALTGQIKAEVEQLRESLVDHLSGTPSQAFLTQLQIYREFEIKPSKIELEALLKLNQANNLGLRCLNRMLESVKSEYRVSTPGETDYSADLTELDRLCFGGIRYGGDFFHELSEVYSGQEREIFREDGSSYRNGSKWDATSLIIANNTFESTVNHLEEMSNRWSGNFKPVIEYSDLKNRERVTEFISDLESAVEAAAIENVDQKMDTNQPASNFSEVIGHYAGRKI